MELRNRIKTELDISEYKFKMSQEEVIDFIIDIKDNVLAKLDVIDPDENCDVEWLIIGYCLGKGIDHEDGFYINLLLRYTFLYFSE